MSAYVHAYSFREVMFVNELLDIDSRAVRREKDDP